MILGHNKNLLVYLYQAIVNRNIASVGYYLGGMKEVDFATVEHRLILVIHGHQPTWLPPIQDALRKELNSLVKIWNLGPNSVVVINDEMARSRGLIQ